MIDFHKVLHKGMYHKKNGHKIRAFFCHWFLRVFYQCDINLQAKVDEDVWFCHSGFGIVINPSAEIRGGGMTIQHSVTIGELTEDSGAPYIGFNVFIGAKATLLGKIKIGDNAKIGAGALVLSDVPDGCTAVGVPAKIIKK